MITVGSSFGVSSLVAHYLMLMLNVFAYRRHDDVTARRSGSYLLLTLFKTNLQRRPHIEVISCPVNILPWPPDGVHLEKITNCFP